MSADSGNDALIADLGGTFLRCALSARDGAIDAVERIRLPGDPRSRVAVMWDEVVDAIVAYEQRHAHRLAPEAAIVFAVPGPVQDGRMTAAPTVLGAQSAVPDIAAVLAARTARSVELVNDVSAAAWYFRERIAARRFIVVTVSSGIGAKMVDRRHPLGVLDDIPPAGEIGHLVVDESAGAPACDCGGRGHLGAIASGRGFERRARAAALHDAAGFAAAAPVTQFGATAAALNNEDHLVPALRIGDVWSSALLAQATRPLARMLHTLCVGSGLDGIVLMGGFAQTLGDTYRALVADMLDTLSDCGPASMQLGDAIVIAAPDEHPSLAGAGAYARRHRRA